MEVIHTILREFKELTPEEQEKVLENMRDINVNYEWWEDNDFKALDDAVAVGFVLDAKHQYGFSGFWSQGDGARINISGYRGDKETPKWIKKLLDNDELHIYQSNNSFFNHYSHSNTFFLDYELYNDICSKKEEELGDFVKGLEEHLRDLSNELYRELETCYEYYTSDESVRGTIIANEYLFDEQLRLS
jgi:hypothetical protein